MMNFPQKLAQTGRVGINICFLLALMAFACSKAQIPISNEQEGELVIIVNEDSAVITVKDIHGILIAETTNRFSSYQLVPGHYLVFGEKEGKQPFSTLVEVLSGKETVVQIELSSPPADAPSLSFSVVSDTVEYGKAVLIEWHSNGFQVIIDQGVGTRGPVGSEEVLFSNPGNKVFTATAYSHDNLLTIKQDSILVKEAAAPILPVIMLSTTSLVTVNASAKITWFSQNADYLVVDYIDNPDSQGSKEITFSTPGLRIVTATAYNQSGYVSSTDTIEVVEPQVTWVDDIIISAEIGVRADKGEAGMVKRDSGIFEIETSGKYQIVTEVWYNSGDSQLNESFYLQVRDHSDYLFLPENSNSGIYKVVPDDPGTPHAASRESGVFDLSRGTHAIDILHYAKISNYYPQLLNGPITGPESVKILGFRLVYLGN